MTHQVIEFHFPALTRYDIVDLLAGLNDPPQRPEDTTSWTPRSHFPFQPVDTILADLSAASNHLLAIRSVHLDRQIGTVEILSLSQLGIREVYKRVRVCWVMIVCSPLMEVIGNVVASCIRCSVLEIDDNVAVVWGTIARRGVELE